MTRPKVLRTPDTRFVGLPGFPFEPHYLELADRRLDSVAHALRGRGPEGRARRPDAARRADLVVPVSQDHPACDGCRVSRGGARLHRFWPVRQAGGASQLHLSEPRRLDAPVCRSTGFAPLYAAAAGLGRADRTAAPCRASAMLRCGAARQHAAAELRAAAARNRGLARTDCRSPGRRAREMPTTSMWGSSSAVCALARSIRRSSLPTTRPSRTRATRPACSSFPA